MVDTSLAGFYSGAGFSNYFSTPSYQSSVVASYNRGAGSKYTRYYNSKGRAFPDVSAQGSKQDVVSYGDFQLGKLSSIMSQSTHLADDATCIFLAQLVVPRLLLLLLPLASLSSTIFSSRPASPPSVGLILLSMLILGLSRTSPLEGRMTAGRAALAYLLLLGGTLVLAWERPCLVN